MPSSLLDFYKDVLDSLGLVVDDDGFIYIKGSKKNILLMVNSKPLVLPNKEQLNSVLEQDEDGKFIVTKIPFNILNENTIRGDSSSLTKAKTIIENRLICGIVTAGLMIIKLASDTKLQKKYSNLDLNILLGEFSKAKNANTKQLIDDKTISNWENMYSATNDPNKKIISVYIKKAGKFNKVSYNRMAVLDSPLYDQLKVADKDNCIVNGVKLRNKDIIVFKLILEYLLPELVNSSSINVPSSDSDAPGFISLFSLYIQASDKILKTLSALQELDKEYYDTAYYKITVTPEMLDSISVYKSELRNIPNESDLNLEAAKKDRADTAAIVTNNIVNAPVTPYPSTPQEIKKEEPKSQVDLVRSILNANGIFTGGYGQQVPVAYTTQQTIVQPVQQPQYVYNQPQQQVRPMTIDDAIRQGQVAQQQQYVYNQPQRQVIGPAGLPEIPNIPGYIDPNRYVGVQQQQVRPIALPSDTYTPQGNYQFRT